MNKTEEAQLFVTINHEQRSVPKHLLDDLEGELKWGSSIPSERIGSIASRLINYLNTDVGYPFYNKVTQQGIASTDKWEAEQSEENIQAADRKLKEIVTLVQEHVQSDELSCIGAKPTSASLVCTGDNYTFVASERKFPGLSTRQH